MRLNGIIDAKIKMIDPKSGHRGYDIAIKSTSERKGHKVELNDFEFICNGTRMGAPNYRPERVLDMLNNTIYKYFIKEREGTDKAVESVEKAEKEEKKEVRTEIPDGKILKALVQRADGEYEVRTNGEPTDEMKTIVNDLMTAHGVARLALVGQLEAINDRLRLGTLDVSKCGNMLVKWNEDGSQTIVKNHVPLKTLRLTLWYFSGMWRNAPSIRKYFNASATEGKYTARFSKGVFSFDKEGLTDLEKQIADDIMLLDRLAS